VIETSAAFTVLPLSVLVPRTNAHVFVVIALALIVTRCVSAVFEEIVTAVVPSGPFTVSVDPAIFVTWPNANPPGLPLPPVRKPPEAGGVPPPGGRACLTTGYAHEPFVAAVIEIRSAAMTPFDFCAPFAITQAPTFRLDRGAGACSVMCALAAETTDLPFGLSGVVIVNVVPLTATTGPETDPWTGDATDTSAAAAIARIILRLPSA
jgi:hypothetical protein